MGERRANRGLPPRSDRQISANVDDVDLLRAIERGQVIVDSANRMMLRRLAREDLCLAGFGAGVVATLLPRGQRIVATARGELTALGSARGVPSTSVRLGPASNELAGNQLRRRGHRLLEAVLRLRVGPGPGRGPDSNADVSQSIGRGDRCRREFASVDVDVASRRRQLERDGHLPVDKR